MDQARDGRIAGKVPLWCIGACGAIGREKSRQSGLGRARPSAAWSNLGDHLAAEVSAENWKLIWASPGFRPTLRHPEPECVIVYELTKYYAPTSDAGIACMESAR